MITIELIQEAAKKINAANDGMKAPFWVMTEEQRVGFNRELALLGYDELVFDEICATPFGSKQILKAVKL